MFVLLGNTYHSKGTTRTRARRALVKLSILDPRTCTVVSRQWALVSTSSSASDVGSSSLPSGTCEDLFGKSRSNCVAASACSSSCACAHDVVKVRRYAALKVRLRCYFLDAIIFKMCTCTALKYYTGLIETSKMHFYGRAAARLSFSDSVLRTFTRLLGAV